MEWETKRINEKEQATRIQSRLLFFFNLYLYFLLIDQAFIDFRQYRIDFENLGMDR